MYYINQWCSICGLTVNFLRPGEKILVAEKIIAYFLFYVNEISIMWPPARFFFTFLSFFWKRFSIWKKVEHHWYKWSSRCAGLYTAAADKITPMTELEISFKSQGHVVTFNFLNDTPCNKTLKTEINASSLSAWFTGNDPLISRFLNRIKLQFSCKISF